MLLDLTSAAHSAPELVIELRVSGGNVELVLAPGMVVDANELSVRHSTLAISGDTEIAGKGVYLPGDHVIPPSKTDAPTSAGKAHPCSP
ncbi:hypothetical protein OIE67_30065 [Nonomuraea fuscirosea]|uniref:hypothetical protein n=1 Tax=Nonomuraea fuscirosea TaxID=1291556 RepID=UPI002DDBBB84|nr:hypothetical protein [Nonomuraea fuscirosea]WSA48323.1 hypothetical protein OIE67_30065 [Nonomuraea fuscirosea]